MSLSLLFWILMVVWFFFGAYRNRGGIGPDFGSDLIVFVLFFLLGWRGFGFIIHN